MSALDYVIERVNELDITEQHNTNMQFEAKKELEDLRSQLAEEEAKNEKLSIQMLEYVKVNIGVAKLNAGLQVRVAELEKAIENSLEWLNHFPSPDNLEEQREYNHRMVIRFLSSTLRESE